MIGYGKKLISAISEVIIGKLFVICSYLYKCILSVFYAVLLHFCVKCTVYVNRTAVVKTVTVVLHCKSRNESEFTGREKCP